YNQSEKELVITIYLCNWIQNYFTVDMDEVALLELRFKNTDIIEEVDVYAESAILSWEAVSNGSKRGISFFLELWVDPKERASKLDYATINVFTDTVEPILLSSLS
ncbi:MAG: hypothetical protein FWF06_05530, partial [Symbiobacteriaceae bacterium]|nr:hypothetical protein [Symbiobacteriaceae bacterium]